MADTRLVQSIWNCRWSYLESRPECVREQCPIEHQWVCDRPPHAIRSISEAECAACPYWEPAARTAAPDGAGAP